ncbi:hypothetical protein GCM10023310_39600 [Paenibacillus vulneris]
MNKAVFLDRDGVLNKCMSDRVKKPKDGTGPVSIPFSFSN